MFVRNGIDDEISPVESEPGVELNRRGIPARKRKKNSLIFGDDDLVSLPVRSPKKKAAAAKPVSQPQLPLTSSRGERKQLPLSSRKGERQLQLPKSQEKEAKKKVRDWMHGVWLNLDLNFFLLGYGAGPNLVGLVNFNY